jgi:hypothetical protein
LTFFTNVFPSAAKPFTASTARSVLQRQVSTTSEMGGVEHFEKKKLNAQPKYFGCIASLNVITLALAGVASDDSKVCTCDGEDGAAIFGVWVEPSLLGVCDSGHVRHEDGDEDRKKALDGKRGEARAGSSSNS